MVTAEVACTVLAAHGFTGVLACLQIGDVSEANWTDACAQSREIVLRLMTMREKGISSNSQKQS